MRKFYVVVLLLVASTGWWGCRDLGRGGSGIVADSDPLNPGKKPPRIYVGPVAGFNRSLHSGGLQSQSLPAPCPEFDSGTENGFYAGMTAEYLLGDPVNSNSSIIARLMYDYQPAYFSVAGDQYPSNFEINGQSQVKDTKTEHITEVKYALLNFEVMYRWNIPGTYFGFSAGPQIGFPISSSMRQDFRLVNNPESPARFTQTPEELAKSKDLKTDFVPVYSDGSQTNIIVYDGAVLNQNGMRAAIKAGVQYEILLKRFILVPAVYYNFGLTKMTTTDNWSVSALQIGADLRFVL